ncbi:hypothetical protein Mgra_00007156, partial [Meloidogyne graminicola]
DKNTLNEQTELFIYKINICKNICNFNNLNSQLATKEAKKLTLIELFNFLTINEGKKNLWNNENIYLEIIDLFIKNIFRDLPPNEKDEEEENEENYFNYSDPAKEHLELIYSIFIKFIGAPDFRPTIAKKLIDQKFIEKIFLFFIQKIYLKGKQLVKISTNSLQIFKEEGKIKYLLNELNKQIIPIILPSIQLTCINHWNKNVKQLAEDIKNILIEIDWKLCNKLINEINI